MMTIEWFGRTDAGKVRENNEDAFSAAVIEAASASRAADGGGQVPCPERGMVFSVADGVGGQSAGEVASAMAVSVIPEELARFAEAPQVQTSRECGRRLETAIRRTNGRVRQDAASDPAKKDMAATLSCLWILGNRAFFGQVGDSRLYRFRGGELSQLSHDQSAVGRMIREGKLTEEEAKVAKSRSLLEQALGMREETFAPEIDWIELLPSDVYLLCSDGLLDRLNDQELAECLVSTIGRGANLSDTANALIRRAEESMSRDNVTVLLVRIGQVGEAATSRARVARPSEARSSRALTLASAALVGCLVGGVTGYFAASWLTARQSQTVGSLPVVEPSVEPLSSEDAPVEPSPAPSEGTNSETDSPMDRIAAFRSLLSQLSSDAELGVPDANREQLVRQADEILGKLSDSLAGEAQGTSASVPSEAEHGAPAHP